VGWVVGGGVVGVVVGAGVMAAAEGPIAR